MLLLDSQAVVWWATGDGRLSATAKAAIRRSDGPVAVSVASLWELEIKRAKGKFRGPQLDEVLAGTGIEFLDITPFHAVTAATLPAHHADPFDRMIVAQALTSRASLVTSDAALAAYDVPIIW